MAQANRGTKRRCAHCGASYYDLDRTPILCPKCATPFQPISVLPRGPARQPRGVRTPEPVIADVDDAEAFKEDEVLNKDLGDEEDEGLDDPDEEEDDKDEEIRE